MQLEKRLVFSQNSLEAIEENSEQSENITYISNSHNNVSFDELMSLQDNTLSERHQISSHSWLKNRALASPPAKNDTEEMDCEIS